MTPIELSNLCERLLINEKDPRKIALMSVAADLLEACHFTGIVGEDGNIVTDVKSEILMRVNETLTPE